MCGRFTLTCEDREGLAGALGVPAEQLPEAEHRPRYNIAPTDSHWVLHMKLEDRELLPAKWGLVNRWAKDATRAVRQINGRAESLAKAPAYRDAFQKRRCAVPADGFFEWVGQKDARRPIWFHRPDGGVFFFAGLYESWEFQPGRWQRTFTIVTTTPNSVVEPVHDRMPAILLDDAVDDWIFSGAADNEKLLALLKPPPDALLVATPVSQRVNSVKNDGPDCLTPI